MAPASQCAAAAPDDEGSGLRFCPCASSRRQLGDELDAPRGAATAEAQQQRPPASHVAISAGQNGTKPCPFAAATAAAAAAAAAATAAAATAAAKQSGAASARVLSAETRPAPPTSHSAAWPLLRAALLGGLALLPLAFAARRILRRGRFT
jgi:hypothetical protein